MAPALRIYADIKARDPVRWCGDPLDGRGRGQAAVPKYPGTQVSYALYTVASLLASTEGPHR